MMREKSYPRLIVGKGAPKLDERWWCSTFDGSTSFSCGAAAVEVSLLSMGWVVFSSGTVGEDVDADRSRCFFAKAATSRANCSTSAWSMSNRLSSSSYRLRTSVRFFANRCLARSISAGLNCSHTARSSYLSAGPTPKLRIRVGCDKVQPFSCVRPNPFRSRTALSRFTNDRHSI